MATEKPSDTGTASSVEQTDIPVAGGSSPEPIPGSDFVGRGIYIKPRQPYELKPFLFKTSGDDRGDARTYTRATTGKTYSIPAACSVNPSPPFPADQSFGQTLIEESWSRFGKQLTLNASGSISGKSVSIDATAFQASSVKSDEDSYYALRSSFVPLWDLYLPSIPNSISAELTALVPPGGFGWQHRAAYAKIFERYGTHLIRNVWVGGKASLIFSVAKSTNLKTHEVRAAVQASLGTGAKAPVEGAIKTESSTSMETFKKNSSCKVFGTGGNGILLAKLSEFQSDAYNGWLDSVEKFPAVIQIGVVGIWTLIEDEKKAEALREAYVRETTFVPLSAIIPIGRYYIFLKDSWGFAMDYLESPYESQIKTLSRVNQDLESARKPKEPEKPKPAAAGNDKAKAAEAIRPLEQALKLENIAEHFPFLTVHEYRDFQRPQAALSLAAVKASGDPLKYRVYLFKNRRCLEVDFNVEKSLQEVKPPAEALHPKAIAELFPGFEFDRVDATLAIPPDKIYLFSGPEYYRVAMGEDGSYRITCREKIINGWPGVDFERLDTATYWKNGKVYFFYEDQFIRYDVSNRRADPGYPKFIPSNYVEDWDFFD